MSRRQSSHAGLAHLQDFRLPQVEAAWNSVSLVVTVGGFTEQLELASGGAHMPSSLRALEGQVKVSAQEVSYDLAAVTCSNSMPSVHGLNTMRRFYTSVVAIVLEYKSQRSVLEFLNAILQKLHGTLCVLRRLSLAEDDLFQVEKLHWTVIQLLSCAVPRSFLIVYRRSPDHNKLVHLPEVQRNLQKLSEHVRLLQLNHIRRQTGVIG